MVSGSSSEEPAIDRAIALLDQILAGNSLNGGGGGGSGASAAPSESNGASASTSRPGSSANVAAAAGAAGAAAAATATRSAAPGARDIFTQQVLFKVARIAKAEPLPNSEKLLRLQADCGPGDQRQIVAGLAKFFTPEQLSGALVVVAANLKPAKLAGEKSEAMVLAAEAAAGPGGALVVRTLVPPEGAAPGDVVHLDGHEAPAGAPKKLSSTSWAAVAPGLVVAGGGKATFEGTPLVTSAGLVTVDLPDGSEIH